MTDSETRPPLLRGVPSDSLVEDLCAAHDPASIAADLNERLIEVALAGMDAAPWTAPRTPSSAHGTAETAAANDVATSAAERAEAEALTASLTCASSHPLLEVAELIRAAHNPIAIDRVRDEALIGTALAKLKHESGQTAAAHRQAKRLDTVPHSFRGLRVLRQAWAPWAVATAMAAGTVLWFSPYHRKNVATDPPPASALVQSRSVAPLFVESFDRHTRTERVDRIYAVRSRELRQNRYATWRVR